MTDKEYREQKKRVQKYIDKWFKVMGLGWFRVDMEWSREPDGETGARTYSQWQYRSATITWFLPHLAKYDDDVVEHTVIHEFCHVLLSPLAQTQQDDGNGSGNQINEYATETVASAMEWVREAGRKDK